MNTRGLTFWTAAPEEWQARLEDATTMARRLRDELELDDDEYREVLHAALEAVRCHAIVAESTQALPLGGLELRNRG